MRNFAFNARNKISTADHLIHCAWLPPLFPHVVQHLQCQLRRIKRCCQRTRHGALVSTPYRNNVHQHPLLPLGRVKYHLNKITDAFVLLLLISFYLTKNDWLVGCTGDASGWTPLVLRRCRLPSAVCTSMLQRDHCISAHVTTARHILNTPRRDVPTADDLVHSYVTDENQPALSKHVPALALLSPTNQPTRIQLACSLYSYG